MKVYVYDCILRDREDMRGTRWEVYKITLLISFVKFGSTWNRAKKKKGNEWHWNSDDKMQEWLLFASGIWWWCLMTMTKAPQNSFLKSKSIWIVLAQWPALHSLLWNIFICKITISPRPLHLLFCKLSLLCLVQIQHSFFSLVKFA